ncbi:3-deoxy-7-phosphoheptulonate synthase [Candidatus Pacearchaeota archaeon]|nr:3-deoxy-7-phosphoheptulonate synthase [Candidatus Pacearchaeota archaeon]MBD3283666.1 3-deoxy-7-phosphoheptulonate synthase [Candidatus Pacearchaeota archaeon]
MLFSINIMHQDYEDLLAPGELQRNISLNEKTRQSIEGTRKEVLDILKGDDSRKLFIIGPCSIHDYDSALEYARKLKVLSDRVKDKIFILMRAYLEKPRTILGWKGFINDPYLDESYNVQKGLELGRRLFRDINELGIGIASEFLDVLVYPYISDLVSFGTIGARTSGSQTHRQIVAGLEMPVGYKNTISGDIGIAINSIITSSESHCFIGINKEGKVCKVIAKGNKNCFLILRGSNHGPNYESEFVREAQKRLNENNLKDSVVVDCSHDNSGKDHKNQDTVFRDVVSQMSSNKGVVGLMLESNLRDGNQKISSNLEKGISITDPCIGWEETEKLVLEAYEAF